MLEVRPALPAELDAVGELVASVYVDDGYVGPDYAAVLRDARGRAAHTMVLAAVHDGTVVGTVTFALGGTAYADRAAEGEAEIRMLATAHAARGHGVGRALTDACVRAAREAGCSAVRLSTQPEMHAAHRLYARLGFLRTPERDWTPVPGVDLLTYVLPLAFCTACGEPPPHVPCRSELDPPRYCGQCKRRMVVQVHPTGWSARCVEHGTVTSG